MNSFEFIDLLLFVGISQGVFLAFVLQLVHNKNKSANKVLSMVLLMAAIMLCGRMFYFRYNTIELFARLAGFVDTLIFLFGPFFYTYFRRLTFNEYPEYRLPWFHFTPAFLHVVFFGWTLFYSVEELSVMAGQWTLGIIYFTVETVGIISNVFYIFKSYQLVRIYEKEEKNNLSFSQHIRSFLSVFLLAIIVFLTLWILSFLNSYFLRLPQLSFVSYNLIWVSIPIFIYVVGFYSLRQPEIFRMPKQKKKVAYSKDRLETKLTESLKTTLEKLIVEEKIYLNNNLTLKDLADRLNTSTNNVSWLLNNVHQCSFYDYINHYRVKEFIEKIQKGEHHNHTLLALSLDAGFNSKSTFNKAFKSEMNDTPSNYIKKLNVV